MVASVAVMEGGREEFEAAKKLYREADVADFKEDCLFGTKTAPLKLAPGAVVPGLLGELLGEAA